MLLILCITDFFSSSTSSSAAAAANICTLRLFQSEHEKIIQTSACKWNQFLFWKNESEQFLSVLCICVPSWWKQRAKRTYINSSKDISVRHTYLFFYTLLHRSKIILTIYTSFVCTSQSSNFKWNFKRLWIKHFTK